MAQGLLGNKPLSKPVLIEFSGTYITRPRRVNILRHEQNGCHFANNIFRCIFVNEKFYIYFKFHWILFLMIQLTIDPRGHFKNADELVDMKALKLSTLYKIIIFQCMGNLFGVEFQREPLKFHTKYLTHTLKYLIFTHNWNFMSSKI